MRPGGIDIGRLYTSAPLLLSACGSDTLVVDGAAFGAMYGDDVSPAAASVCTVPVFCSVVVVVGDV